MVPHLLSRRNFINFRHENNYWKIFFIAYWIERREMFDLEEKTKQSQIIFLNIIGNLGEMLCHQNGQFFYDHIFIDFNCTTLKRQVLKITFLFKFKMRQNIQ